MRFSSAGEGYLFFHDVVCYSKTIEGRALCVYWASTQQTDLLAGVKAPKGREKDE
jgi:hypothetical protein